MGRLKSCKHCGRIHDVVLDCGKKPVVQKKTDLDKFRSSKAWQKKRAEIRERDFNLCRMSLYYGRLVYDDLSVHHIDPLHQAWDKCLDEGNLITLSGYWHEQAEAGAVDKKLLKMLANSPPGEAKGDFRRWGTPTAALQRE